MRYQSLLLSSFLVTIIALPLSVQASPLTDALNRPTKTSPLMDALNRETKARNLRDNTFIISAYRRMAAGIEGKNFDQTFAYIATTYRESDDKGKTKNLQQVRQDMSEIFKTFSNLKVSYKVESISYSGQSATVSASMHSSGVSSRANNSFSGKDKFQDTWIWSNNAWKVTNRNTLSTNIVWATPKRQSNPTKQSNHDLTQSFNLANQAIDECLDQRRSEACNRFNQIKSTLLTWCTEGNEDACITYSSVDNTYNIKNLNQTIINSQ